ncbi:uncharacterized protein [Symphalangus syndactylus]
MRDLRPKSAPWARPVLSPPLAASGLPSTWAVGGEQESPQAWPSDSSLDCPARSSHPHHAQQHPQLLSGQPSVLSAQEGNPEGCGSEMQARFSPGARVFFQTHYICLKPCPPGCHHRQNGRLGPWNQRSSPATEGGWWPRDTLKWAGGDTVSPEIQLTLKTIRLCKGGQVEPEQKAGFAVGFSPQMMYSRGAFAHHFASTKNRPRLSEAWRLRMSGNAWESFPHFRPVCSPARCKGRSCQRLWEHQR